MPFNNDADHSNADLNKYLDEDTFVSNIDGTNLTPIFYSEISSSYMLYDLFSTQGDVAKDFITHFLNIPVDSEIRVKREKNYHGKGSIDIFLDFYSNKRRTAVVIEVKVHDYISATPGQIETYFNAVNKEAKFDNIHFIYLTQFNQSNFSYDDNVVYPPTMEEYDKAKKVFVNDNLKHLNWVEVNDF